MLDLRQIFAGIVSGTGLLPVYIEGDLCVVMIATTVPLVEVHARYV